MIRFNFDESKAIETLVYVARVWPGITPLYLSKVLFFADRDHLRDYGRPVTGDAYMAMANGPVPSRIYDIIKGELDFFGAPAAIVDALIIDQKAKYHEISARRAPNIDLLSETDIATLDNAIEFCRGRSFTDLSNLTHQEPAWIKAQAMPKWISNFWCQRKCARRSERQRPMRSFDYRPHLPRSHYAR